MAFLSDQGKQAIVDAVKAVEAETSAEVVVVVRARSRGYAATGFAASWAAAVSMLAFLLYSPWEFGLHRFLIDVKKISTMKMRLKREREIDWGS